MNKELLIQIGIEVLSAFFGFLFALLLADMLERKENRRKYRNAIKCLNNELQDILEGLEAYVQNGHEFKSRIAIPTWDALQYAGMTLEFIDKGYFESLVKVYSLIRQFNEDYRANSSEDNRRLIDRIITTGHETLRQISKGGI